ncbi:MAG: T9SS type A sorting domain-containing protein [Bacteroidia bacterium]|nr:T9SS type A sorting domain-containing protein [Bacteroidia bacterium]
MKNIYTLLILISLATLASQNVNAQMAAPGFPGGGALYVQPQISPNPSRDWVKVTWQQVLSGNVRIVLYLNGNYIGTYVNQNYSVGEHSTSFKVTGLSSGLYVVKISMPGQSSSQKLFVE